MPKHCYVCKKPLAVARKKDNLRWKEKKVHLKRDSYGKWRQYCPRCWKRVILKK